MLVSINKVLLAEQKKPKYLAFFIQPTKKTPPQSCRHFVLKLWDDTSKPFFGPFLAHHQISHLVFMLPCVIPLMETYQHYVKSFYNYRGSLLGMGMGVLGLLALEVYCYNFNLCHFFFVYFSNFVMFQTHFYCSYY